MSLLQNNECISDYLTMQKTTATVSLSKVLGSDRGLGLEARTETAVLGSISEDRGLGKHLDKL